MTIQQIQAAIDSKANDPRQLINMIADYLQANPGGSPSPGSSYLVYAANLSQSGTNAPVPSELGTPTLEGVSFVYESAGAYYATSENFVAGKTWCYFQPIGGFNSSIKRVNSEILFNEVGYPEKIIFLSTDDGINGQNDWNAVMSIEIRVYQ